MRRACCSVREFPEMESVKVTWVFIGFQKRKGWVGRMTPHPDDRSVGWHIDRMAARSDGNPAGWHLVQVRGATIFYISIAIASDAMRCDNVS